LVVWQEAHRALAAMPKRSAEATKTLWTNLGLKELNTDKRRFVLEGFEEAMRTDPRHAKPLLDKALEEISATEAYRRADASSVIALVNQDEGYRALFAAYEKEKVAGVRSEMGIALATWDDARAFPLTEFWRRAFFDRHDSFERRVRLLKVFVRYFPPDRVEALELRVKEAASDPKGDLSAPFLRGALDAIKAKSEYGPSFYPDPLDRISALRNATPEEADNIFKSVLRDLEAHAHAADEFETHAARMDKSPRPPFLHVSQQLEALLPGLNDPCAADFGLSPDVIEELEAPLLGPILAFAIAPSEDAAKELLAFAEAIKNHQRQADVARAFIYRVLACYGKRLVKPIALPQARSDDERLWLRLADHAINGITQEHWLDEVDLETMLTRRKGELLAHYTSGPIGKSVLPMLAKSIGAGKAFAAAKSLEASYWLNRRSGLWHGFTPDLALEEAALAALRKRWSTWTTSLGGKSFNITSGLYK
ncbi:MAG: hypothetical protein KDB07_05590, partial [Planctomycetes bacterium]|nr:hypothetical protein [Planctomycetota bacterium]